MKQGNQFYLEFEISDEEDNVLDINSVEKVEFTIGDIQKTYPNDTEYEDGKFKVFLTQEDTFNLNGDVSVEVRVKFKNNTVIGSDVIKERVLDSISTTIL